MRLFLLRQRSLQYRYLPLCNDEIRPIELQPACFGPDLSITFKYTSVKEAANSYEALSYTWGNPAQPDVLLCGGSHLQITTSLKSALLNLRLDSAPRMLWIDAICINQIDPVERGRQVVLMDKVYRNASKTIVYLGDKSVDSDLAAEYLKTHMDRVKQGLANFMNQRRAAEDASEMLAICIKMLGTSQAKLFEGFDPNTVQEALVNLLSRPWFRRIWVIQEFVVSPNIDMYCGRTSCEWGSFSMMFNYSFVEAHVSWDHITPPKRKLDFFRGLTQIMQMHELRQKFHSKDSDNPPPENLFWLLSRCRTAEATMPVDKVFALLNLSSKGRNIEPDYLKSKADIYREFAELALQDGSNILSEAALTNRADPSLPSWVPDWSEPPARINLSHILVAPEGFIHFNVHKGSRVQDQARPQIRGDSLFVKGIILQTIAVVGGDRPVPGTNIDEAPNLTNLIIILSYIRALLQVEGLYPTGEEMDMVAGILLEANQVRGAGNVRSFWENTQSRDLLFEPEISVLSPDTDNLHEAISHRRLADPLGYANMCRAIAGRRLAITDQQYAGLVPRDARYGDKICIIQGFNVPYVLRQVGDHYILIGDAYVHGIMLGEAFLQDESVNDSMVEIKIC
ncbi:hypothetical protein EKO27_g2232 [Xylaria grammica]|uniref:Heterokaryon incompatibility domain-containing protein n=1 Tax=Xylaria grammica TaxID=363999 RepID=A0A439DER1_9PEZI|nr:hypothetical protein EKO27_g2232 [Xylaria grammica]